MSMTLATYFGIAGLIANTIWPLLSTRYYLLAGQVIASGFMFAHFYLLNAKTGAVIMLVAGIQALLALPLEKYPKFTKVYLCSILLTPLLCWYTWSGIPSLLSSCALMVYCIANLNTQVKIIKMYLLMCILFWFGHNFIVNSVPGLISNTLALSTLSYSLFKLSFRRTGQATNSLIDGRN